MKRRDLFKSIGLSCLIPIIPALMKIKKESIKGRSVDIEIIDDIGKIGEKYNDNMTNIKRAIYISINGSNMNGAGTKYKPYRTLSYAQNKSDEQPLKKGITMLTFLESGIKTKYYKEIKS